MIMSFLLSTSRTPISTAAASYFPSSYREARERFQASADAAGCQLTSWEIAARGPQGETLAIDAARWGNAHARRWLLVTTGLHGSEAPFGSAVALRLLDQLTQQEPADDVGIILLHALNPYGYAWVRRTNEDNIDLNRNGLLPNEEYSGAHPLYHHVYNAFDPHRRRRVESFYLQAWWLIMRHTKAALQCSLPVGQYEYPKGLFYGGKGPAESLKLLQHHLPQWMPEAQEVMHFDYHTGLGRWADCRLLIDVPDEHEDAQWLSRWAPPGVVESAANNRTAYHARGSLGPWMKHYVFPNAHYHYAAAEFGTFGNVAVLRSLVKELQAHYSCQPGDRYYLQTKRLLSETFVPRSPHWRRRTLEQGVGLCRKAYEQLAADQ